ncbi:MAG TPA: hypothetical protein DCG57_06160 [Candidatus Riflebacteria bacterium]|nr:hypothetical protein [Candidatus Riflebacteria bacterium]
MKTIKLPANKLTWRAIVCYMAVLCECAGTFRDGQTLFKIDIFFIIYAGVAGKYGANGFCY